MIERYTRQEMKLVWEPEAKFTKMLEVEIAVAQVQAQLGIIPKKAAKDIATKGHFSLGRIQEIEQVTKHDVIAFVSNVAENVGPEGKYVHFGMTSSDVLDTAFSLQVRDAVEVLLTSVTRLERALKEKMREHAETLCAGRTHGMFAEPTSFGVKLAGFYTELQRNRQRIEKAAEQMMICKLSGAVGTYSSQPRDVEERVAKRLFLKSEIIATQVVPRDRHTEMMYSLASLGSGLERLAVELRHLQRSEVGEVTEGFSQGQKGSSAMPHKKNPISSENITGLARLLRGYLISSFENIALWHERDISHSSVERVIFPDAFIVADYAVHRMAQVVEALDVNTKRMLENIELSQGQLFSSHVLLALVNKGLSREEAYSHVQRLSHSLKPGEHLKKKLIDDPAIKKLLKSREVEEIFEAQRYKRSLKPLVTRALDS